MLFRSFGALGLIFPLVVPAIGVVTAVIGILAVTPSPKDRSGMQAINRGFFISAGVSAVLVAVAAYIFLPESVIVGSGLDAVKANPRTIAIAAVVIGGTSLSGGVGRITGTIFGVLILGVMTSGFTFIRIDAYYQEMVKGAIDRKSTRLNSSHSQQSRMPSSA